MVVCGYGGAMVRDKQSNRLTLEEYNEQVLKPSVLAHIKNGSLDVALMLPENYEVITDKEILKAIEERLKIINEGGSEKVNHLIRLKDGFKI